MLFEKKTCFVEEKNLIFMQFLWQFLPSLHAKVNLKIH